LLQIIKTSVLMCECIVQMNWASSWKKNHDACFVYEAGPAGNVMWETAHINEYGK